MSERGTDSLPSGSGLPSRAGLQPVHIALFGLAALTLFRLWYCTWVELVPDEGYYWIWSKHLAASYRDKGPGIAWAIALGTRGFGDTVLGIRVVGVLLSAGTGWELYRLARRLYDERTALWCLLVALIMPLFAVGAILMTIDSLSVFFWAWAMNLLWSALDTGKMRYRAVLCGGLIVTYSNNRIRAREVGGRPGTPDVLQPSPADSLCLKNYTASCMVCVISCILIFLSPTFQDYG